MFNLLGRGKGIRRTTIVLAIAISLFLISAVVASAAYYAGSASSGESFGSTVPKTTSSTQARSENHISVFSARPLAVYYWNSTVGTNGYANTGGVDQLLLETYVSSNGASQSRCQVTGGSFPVLGKCWTNGSA